MDIKHVAKLANLPITADQEKKLAKAFAETLEFVGQINKLNTAGVEPSAQVTGLTNVTRPDEIDEKRMIKIGDYFKVPAIFDQD